VEQHPNIHLYCFSELEDVKGYVGNFELVIRNKATSVDKRKCTGVANVFNLPVELFQSLREGWDAKGD